MGRPPSNGGPSFRFNSDEVAQMEAILQAHNVAIPDREVMLALAEKFSDSLDRKDKFIVQMKQTLCNVALASRISAYKVKEEEEEVIMKKKRKYEEEVLKRKEGPPLLGGRSMI
ncbi:hypothetical protein ACFE04_022210 [Oxalis oulophora]